MFLCLIVLHSTRKRVVSRRSMLYPAPRWKQRSPLARLLIEGLCRIGKDFPLPKNDDRIPTLPQTTGKGCFPHIVVAQGKIETLPNSPVFLMII